jgi:AtzE family amidohydrolase
VSAGWTATETAAAIKSRVMSASEAVTAALERIHADDPTLNCFTEILSDKALSQATAIDRAIQSGGNPGPLAGVPFAVKNLFDIAGLPTLAGAKINAEHPAARTDATAIRLLKAAGAVLVGALNMDEYAYGFVTENAHYGATRNPWDPSRIAGGSSGGSAAAVAAGLIPMTLGSDTNGSVRVPAGLCGVYGFKPTYGRLSRAGCAAFVASLDHVGMFTRSVADAAQLFDIIHGHDVADPISSTRPRTPILPTIHHGIDGLRIAVAGEYFEQNAEPEVLEAVARVAAALGTTQRVALPEAARARAAAFLITASEGAALHLDDLRRCPQDFDPATRDRLLAGALIPSAWVNRAQRFRRWYQTEVQALFRKVDIILAPSTPCAAPKIGQKTMVVGGNELPVRASLGLFTQPISFIGLPVLNVPVLGCGPLPLGVQIIAAPYQEANLVRVAAMLEAGGVTSAPAVDFRKAMAHA